MTDLEVLELLSKIDNGYKPIEAEKEELSYIENIYWKDIEKIPESIDILTGLKILNIYGKFKDNSSLMIIPDSIGNLTSLQRLNLNSTNIGSLPESIGNLTNLQRLYLQNSQISSLPDSIRNLTSLQHLELYNTPICTLPESIGNLTNLQNLNLNSIQISTLPDSIGNLSGLQRLYLSNTQLSMLPDSIGNLSGLQHLYLNLTQLSMLPDSIGNLSSLQRLYLNFTRLSMLPDGIGNLSGLQYLDLSSTRISTLPDTIGKLPKLKELILEDLTLSELPVSLLGLNLEYENREYHFWKEEPGIYIHGLRLQKQPVSLFYQPRELIVDYYKQHGIEINETKVIFLGSEGVGKTHTIKRILNDNFKISEALKETPGISISFKDFVTGDLSYRINFWDFGGQQIMHAMHRCFLTNRTGYVIVV